MVSGSVFADVKRFSGDSTSLPLDGTAFGAGGRIGTTLAPHWIVELGVDAGRTTTTVRDETSLPAIRRQARTRNQLMAVAAVVGFHPRTSGRLQPGYLGGVTLLHVIRKTDNLIGDLPQPIGHRRTIDNVTAATIGFEMRVGLRRHLAVVPEVRALAFTLSGSGPSGFAIRPGVAMRWDF